MHKSKSDLMVQISGIQGFHDHWTNCKSLIEEADNGVLSTAKIELIFYHVGEIILLVVGEHSSNVTSERNKLIQGSYLEAIIKSNVFESLLIWIEGNPTPKDEKSINARDVLRGNLIIAFEQLITQSKQNVLLYRPILQPLCQLLFKLSSQLRPSYDQLFGRLLHEVCILLCRCDQLLEFSKELCSEIFNQPYMIFSLLVPLVHRNDQLGDSARDSLLIVFALSKKDDNVGQYLAYESDICPVLATGLSGLYSSLPKKLVPRYGLRYNNDDISVKSPGGRVSVTTPIYIQSDLLNPCLLELQVGGAEWHQLTENECSNSIDLRRFLRTLHFCNLTVKVSKTHVRVYFYSDFKPLTMLICK
ncbi:Protein FAM160A1 [Schistosoma japonicum]|nr:Protein FAM160A1 [Schistosoma japonicum]